ncbi:MAG TPA: type II toxin-antitoxin system RelE/ParE family toxin [Vicinamibacterales bacterium]|nr:type II toxin-antitoxin system RelE/ParE family toxin [Vicinamibacterales bacterium]
MILPVVTTSVSDDHIQTIDAWWRENRPVAAGLFAEELAACIELLGRMPRAGRRYRHPHVSNLRRVLLRTSRYHVYYVVHDTQIVIHAVWHARRGTGPELAAS